MNKQNEFNQESGTVIVFFVLILTVLLGISAFVIDVGFLQWQKRHLQNTADAAALAGAREYIDGTPTLANITNVVNQYVLLNDVIVTEVKSVTLDNVDSPNNNTVTVVLSGNRQLFFGRIFDKHESGIEVKATAIAAPISGISGLIPLYLEEKNLPTNINYGVTYNKFNDSTLNPGNWGLTNFNDQSSNPNYRKWFSDGYDKILNIGNTIETKPGNSIQSVSDEVERIVGQKRIIPVVEELKKGGKNVLEIRGFIVVEITKLVYKNEKNEKNNIEEVHVIFHEMVEIGDVDPNDPTVPNYGLQGLRLIE